MLLDRRVPSGPRLAPLCAMPRTHGSRRVPPLYSSVSSCAPYRSDPLMTRRWVRATRYFLRFHPEAGSASGCPFQNTTSAFAEIIYQTVYGCCVPVRDDPGRAAATAGREPLVLEPGRDRHAARGRAADVRMVGAIDHETAVLGPMEERCDEGDVREVRPAQVGIVSLCLPVPGLGTRRSPDIVKAMLPRCTGGCAPPVPTAGPSRRTRCGSRYAGASRSPGIAALMPHVFL